MQHVFRKLKIRPFSINLTQTKLSKIKIGCLENPTGNGAKLLFNLQEEGKNTLRIQISSKRPDDSGYSTKQRAEEPEEFDDMNNPCKRRKIDEPTMSLRPRTAKKIHQEAKQKKSTAIVSLRSIPKPKPLDVVEIGEVVLCKIRGYCEWPAMVTGYEKQLIVIKFFGDHTTYKTAIHNFFSFKDSHETIAHNLRSRKTPLFAKSIREAEIFLGIPECNSIVSNSV